MPPPYHSTKTVYIPSKSDDCDRNMNNTLTSNKNLKLAGSDEYGFELHNPRVSRDGLERAGSGGSLKHTMSEARNEEVLRRVAEMQKMVESSERYLNEHGEYCHEFDVRPGKLNLWRETSVDVESDCESMNSSKQSSNEDAPGVLRHSDSLTLLSETINQGLDGIAKGLNSIYTAPFSEVNGRLDNPSAQSTPKGQRKVQGLSQILSDLQALGNDLSQSESDSESLYTPNSSPIHNKNTNQMPQTSLRNKTLRTSFGLHSPDSSILGCDTKDMNLKEYLRQLKEASSGDNADNTDLAAKKIAELYGYEIGDDTIIETDPDIIDLRSIPPPQTPDELDNLNVLNVPPTGFDDSSSPTTAGHLPGADSIVGDLEEFLKKVKIEPPTQKITPAVELTPEEILSYIIPPPPGLADTDPGTKPSKPPALKTNPPSIQQLANNNTTNTKNLNHVTAEPPVPKPRLSTETNSINLLAKYDKSRFEVYYPPEIREEKSTEYDLYSNSEAANANTIKPTTNSEKTNGHVIEYPTVDRKGPFSCCTKTKKEKTEESTDQQAPNGGVPNSDPKSKEFALPPKRCPHVADTTPPPERPPKSAELQLKLNSPVRSPNYAKINGNSGNYYEMDPPSLPPRFEKQSSSPPSVTLSTLPPRKPPLPPIAQKPCIRSPVPILKNPTTFILSNSANNSPIRTAGIGSPHFHRNPNCYREIERAFNREDLSEKSSPGARSMSPTPTSRQNGHYRSHSDCPPVCLKNPSAENKPQLSLLCSPQMSRKTNLSNPGSPILSNKNGHVLNVDTLMAKTDVAMAGLLVKLDQVAAMCSAAQTAGGGTSIDEEKFQHAKDELTDQSLHLVTSSKHLVVSMSDANLINLPEHLTACLSSLRRITELAQDLTRYTSAPLQTRNIVLKVHDVASSFRELACVRVGPLGAGQLALHAECLANVLATLLRSLRVFSP